MQVREKTYDVSRKETLQLVSIKIFEIYNSSIFLGFCQKENLETIMETIINTEEERLRGFVREVQDTLK